MRRPAPALRRTARSRHLDLTKDAACPSGSDGTAGARRRRRRADRVGPPWRGLHAPGELRGACPLATYGGGSAAPPSSARATPVHLPPPSPRSGATKIPAPSSPLHLFTPNRSIAGGPCGPQCRLGRVGHPDAEHSAPCSCAPWRQRVPRHGAFKLHCGRVTNRCRCASLQ